MFRYGVSDSRVYVFGSNIMQTHIPEGQPRGHHKLNRIVVCDNLFFMRAKFLRQNMQQTVWGLLKVNVELLLLFLVQVIEIKKGVPGQ